MHQIKFADVKWSKLKKSIEDRFADSVKGKVKIYTTRYTIGSNFMVRGWITINGEEIANFSTPDNYNKFSWNTPDIDKRIPENERTENSAVEKGEFSRYEFFDACNSFLNLSIEDALICPNPIVKAFAVIDSRFGKRRMLSFNNENEHPLVLKLLDFRMKEEGLK